MAPRPPSDSLGNLVRLTPLHQTDLPSHPSLPNSPSRPQLLPFLLELLAQGSSFLSPTTFPSKFAHHSTKRDAEATANHSVEVHKLDIPSSKLQSIPWSSGPIKRSTPSPSTISTEHWFTRHSRHPNTPSTSPAAQKVGGASWEEFVFGLRDAHSKHEEDFTPTLYDAHYILDWNDEIKTLESEDQLANYTHCTLAVYEMCHAIPAPLQPRCFPVLVATASTSQTSFLAITVPLDLGDSLGFYSMGKNVKEGTTPQQRKPVVLGAYAAVETVYIDQKRGGEEGEDVVDWTMGTASDTRGNLPMFMQKMGLPGAVVKDVGYFLKWIRLVSREEIRLQL